MRPPRQHDPVLSSGTMTTAGHTMAEPAQPQHSTAGPVAARWNSRAQTNRVPGIPPAGGSAAPIAMRPAADGVIAPVLVGLYLFLYYSRILDVSRLYWLHLPMIFLGVLLLLALFSGEMRRVIQTRLGAAVAVLTGWVCFCLPFSTWPGGSVESIKLTLQAFAVFCVTLTLVRSFRDWLKVAYSMGLAVGAAACLSFVFGKAVQGRVAFAEGLNADPNQYALVLLTGLPFLWLLAKRSSPLSAVKLFALAATVPVFVAFFRTGSRAGLLCLIAIAAILFLYSSPLQKLKLSALAFILAVCAVVWLPSYLKVRFLAFFSAASAAVEELDDQSLHYLGGDMGSSQARWQLIKDSLLMTVRHPIFGIGPGQFAQSNWEAGKREGLRKGYHVSHNTYLQYSSETGVLGFVIYTSALILALLDLRRIHKEAKWRARTNPYYQQYVVAAQYLIASVVSFMVGSFFLSLAYSIVVYSMFALVAAFSLSVRTLMDNDRYPAAATAQPAVTSSFREPSRRAGF